MAGPPAEVSKLQAGGGIPTAAAASKKVETLSPTILNYLKSTFRSLLDDGNLPNEQKVIDFLVNTQRVDASHMTSTLFSCERSAFNEFLQYCTSSDLNALAAAQPQDLSYPISNYFISSSHNTYLTGSQLYGQSTTSGYTNALLRGCRCIEIDVWDGEPLKLVEDVKSAADGEEKHHHLPHIPSTLSSRMHKVNITDAKTAPAPKGEDSEKLTPWKSYETMSRAEPRVLHGYTLTREISLRNVCTAIKTSAFVTTDLPVIISLELHLNLEQQEIMVDIMREIWGDMLLDKAIGQNQDDDVPLVSPDELRGKILVKVKHVTEKVLDENAGSASLPAAQRVTSVSSSGSDVEVSGKDAAKKPKPIKVIEALSKLGVYTRSYHFSTFSQPEASIPTHVFSLSEKTLMDMHETHATALFSHNRNFLMRAYPSGLRVSSSNLDPSVFWRKGVQMVALNWQSCDEGMMLNEAMFAGEQGWVLKPSGYRSADVSPERATAAIGQGEAIAHKTLNLTIQVFAAQNIPLPSADDSAAALRPYIKCELHVEKPEERTGKPIEGGGRSKEGEHKRRTKPHKGTEPDFEGEMLQFADIQDVVEELSFLRFKIYNHKMAKDDLAAWACIRLDRLQQGYRFVTLLDTKGQETTGLLLVRVTKKLT